ncbi:DUF1572 family protein [Fulvivirgaceae bacterium PWU4]|uniref:DUF1572 family protein n=1 Tax=Chryseosolibacter histidini TaxID=2782349 RepID=A0AAP2DP27_9BACT|nr:DinB family protein [Chryseosolibacter histidini]MBT1699888.1 DUF1572 family protein [Chryseosolibacter histidini]
MKNTLIESFVFLFERELDKLEAEIKQYPDEASVWKLEGDIKNPGGNLCLHLCGNLQQYIGEQLGHSGYQRNRPLEFSARDVSRAQLLNEIQKTKLVVSATLRKLDDESIRQMYPEEVLGYPMTTVFFLTHLLAHLGYHLGQINYHRRLIGR